MTLHYSIIGKIVKRENLPLAMITVILAIAITAYAYYGNGCRFTKENVLLLCPTTYLAGALMWRYLIFQSYFKKYFPLKKPPYDPEIVYFTRSGLSWNKKNYEVTPTEVMYSILIFIFPFICLFFIASLLEHQYNELSN
jgi:membrane protease YdiL (CAAX protease family)